MEEKVFVVSVVRDRAMYARCLSDNPHCRDTVLCPVYNQPENQGIPFRYNQFLSTFQKEGWLVFCHEDWMPLEDLKPCLQGLDRQFLYGPIGAYMETCPHADFIHLCGDILQCRKDGSRTKHIRGTWTDGQADCFDCQCIIVHSSLLRGQSLRFDEHLSFDLYAEDFCAAAWQKGVPSRILPLRCRHYSGGNVGPRYWEGLDYLRAKYQACPKRFPSPVLRRNSFGGAQDKPLFNYRRTPWARLRYLVKR